MTGLLLLLLTTLAAAPAHAQQTGICGRTVEVRDAIVALIPDVDNCADVTADHLGAITDTLWLSDRGITALAAGDFDGLTALPTLVLSINALATLPAGVFDGLTSLRELWLDDSGHRADLTYGVVAGRQRSDHASRRGVRRVDRVDGAVSVRQRSDHASRRGVRRVDRVDGAAIAGQPGGALHAEAVSALPAERFLHAGRMADPECDGR